MVGRFGVTVVTAALLLTTAACGTGGDDQSAGSGNGGGGGSAAQDDAIRKLFPQEILDSGTLRVGTVAPAPPHAMLESGKITSGLDFDLLTAVAEMAGLKAEFTPYPFDALMPALQADKIDVTGTILPSSDRLTVADFAIWFKVPYGLLLPKDNPYGIKGASDLCGHKVALVNGSTPPQRLVEDRQKACESKGKPIQKTLYSDQDSAVLAVKTGQADAFIQGESVTAWIAKSADGGSTFTSVPDLEGLGGTVFFTDGFAALKSNQDLLKAVQTSLKKLVDNGEYQKVLDKYGVSGNAVKEITINKLSPADSAS
jgi:polar amino acid transport system substrate-binding protein